MISSILCIILLHSFTFIVKVYKTLMMSKLQFITGLNLSYLITFITAASSSSIFLCCT